MFSGVSEELLTLTASHAVTLFCLSLYTSPLRYVLLQLIELCDGYIQLLLEFLGLHALYSYLYSTVGHTFPHLTPHCPHLSTL